MSKKRIEAHRDDTWLYLISITGLILFVLVHNTVIPLDDVPFESHMEMNHED